MRKTNPVRYSSAVGEAWMHCMFKVKYSHKLFDDELYREGMLTLLLEAAYEYQIEISEIGFDDNHVHFLADIGLYARYEVAKLLRGYTAKKFFEHFPEAKRKYFWDSGLWNPSYYIGSPHDLAATIRYIQGQKFGKRMKGQQRLLSFAA